MAEQKFYTPLKVGLLVVVIAYFLFTFHAMFTLSWIGEWEPVRGYFGFVLLVEDISATIGLIFRFIASIMAITAISLYFAKKNISKPTAYKILRWVLVFEGIYWLGLVATAGFSVQGFGQMVLNNLPLVSLLNSLLYVIPTVVESVILPITLFILAFKLNPNKPLRGAIKWALITGTIYITVFWLVNTSMWIATVAQKGNQYLTAYPENLLSLILTIFGLLALAIYTARFAKKSSGAETLQELKLRTIGGIMLSLGMYFLWNYLSWIFFGGDYLWSDWYAWFLGHNMDLWMLSLPLVGLPLLFYNKPSKQTTNSFDSRADLRKNVERKNLT